MLKVSRSVVINRPLDEVCAQFGDVGYHERRGHHRGVQFRVVAEDDVRCEYEQTTKVGPLKLRQEFELNRSDPAHQVNVLSKGAFSPGDITFVISEAADEGTLVTATLTSRRGGATRVVAPIVRQLLGRALQQGLVEDRADLERGDYARRNDSAN